MAAVVTTLVVATVVGIITNAWGALLVIGLAALAAYVAAADERRAKRERAALEARMGDVSMLGGSWAATLRRAWVARDGTRACIEGLEPGPRRERLGDALREMDECLVEAGRIARAGSEMETRAARLAPRRVDRQARRARRAGAREEDLETLERQAEEGRRYARNVDRVRWSLEVHVNEMEAIAADTAVVGLEPEALGRLADRSTRTREALTALSLATADVEGAVELERHGPSDPAARPDPAAPADPAPSADPDDESHRRGGQQPG